MSHPFHREAARTARYLGIMRPAQVTAPAASASRKPYLDKLGLPEDSSNDQAFAALDAKLTQNRTHAAPPQSQARTPEDALYDALYGATDKPVLPTEDDALYVAMGWSEHA